MVDAALALHPSIDRAALRAEFARTGRIRIDPFLAPAAAAALRASLLERADWRVVMNAGEKVFEMDVSAEASLSAAQRQQLDALIDRSAGAGFQFRFDTIRVPDDPAQRSRGHSLLERFAEFMSSPPVVALMKDITGRDDIDFADAQATRYRPGHFLTAHDDAVEGKRRRAAYVLGLTPDWRSDWGGQLVFRDPSAGDEHFVPAFNTLTLFAVPQVHEVTRVQAHAGAVRVSVTGWLRAAG